MSVKDLIIKEIDKLPEDYLNEVYDFILFLENKKERVSPAQEAQELSKVSFAKIWDNPEDAVYDRL